MSVFAAVVVNAQSTQSQSAQQQPNQVQGNRQPKDAKTRAMHITKKMTKQLGLSPDVRDKVYEVNYATAQKMIDIDAKYSGDKKAGAAERKEIKEERDNRLKTLLSADQFAKWEQFERDQKKRAKSRMKGPKPVQPQSGN